LELESRILVGRGFIDSYSAARPGQQIWMGGARNTREPTPDSLGSSIEELWSPIAKRSIMRIDRLDLLWESSQNLVNGGRVLGTAVAGDEYHSTSPRHAIAVSVDDRRSRQTMLTVFAVMPISESTRQMWEKGIRAACDALGIDCGRADLIGTPGLIVNQIYESIAKADVIVGEMSGQNPNPNVFYEVGAAFGLGKPTVLLAASGDDLKAFDTQGYRHFLHGGDSKKARDYLMGVLPQIERELDVAGEVQVPNGIVLYEWPSPNFKPPEFAWPSGKEEGYLQVDLDGGQRIISAPNIGQIICITNTADLWNHHAGCSIMKLLSTRELRSGDVLHLFLNARATDAGQPSDTRQLDFVGDCGWADGTSGTNWVTAWHEAHVPIRSTPRWTHWPLKLRVEPTVPEYDPGRGTTVYLLTKCGRSTLCLRRIRLIRRPAL
jgi:hypothetical protein